MKLARTMLAGAVLVLCSASTAMAGPKILSTAPASQDNPTTQTLYCDIVNLDGVPRNVTIDIMDSNGLSVSGPIGPFLLQPNEAVAFPSSTGASWCRFTVDTSTKKFRGVAVYDNGSEYTLSIPAQ